MAPSSLSRAIAIAFLTSSTQVWANGRYPASGAIAFDPNDPSHLVVSATFGLLDSRDGAKSFLWQCESSLGVTGQQDLMIAVTAGGATVVSRFDGMVRTSDGCSFEESPELAGKNVADLTLFRSAPHSLAAFYVDSKPEGGFDSQIVRSDDDGQTWKPVGAPLPIDLLPLTIDAAPSDASRIYLSGRLGTADNFASALYRSKDGGVTFERTIVPESEVHHLAYIAAVHPLDPDRVYVRVWNPNGTSLWISDDGGVAFRKVFTGTDQLLGFAVSPDGTEIAFGGPSDGIWIGPADGTNLTKRSTVRPTCLGWSADGIFACADVSTDGFSLGRSRDHGATFDPILQFASLCGKTACAATTPAAGKCAADWNVVGPLIGAACGLGLDAGASRDGATDAASPATQPVDRAGCGCAWVTPSGGRRGWIAVLVIALALRARKGRSLSAT